MLLGLRVADSGRIVFQEAMDHLRYSGLSFAEQRTVFLTVVQSDPIVRTALDAARSLDLPDWLIVSGVLYNAVWNALTNRPPGHGTKDIDVFYFDDSDLSYEAEDRVIVCGASHFARLPLPVEIRNQARVHLWYPRKFGRQCSRYTSSRDSTRYFASKTHAVGLRLKGDGDLELIAPFGLDDIFSFRVTPNRALDNQQTHEAKGKRIKQNWPEVTILPW